jgi:hypothetical protein
MKFKVMPNVNSLKLFEFVKTIEEFEACYREDQHSTHTRQFE